MITFDSLNIRKGLELDVELADIFRIDIREQGDKVAKEVCELGWAAYSTINPSSAKAIVESGGTIYTSEKTKIKISNNLVAYVFDSYLIEVDYEDDLVVPIVFTNITKEMEFVNTEVLTFDQFAENVMVAHRFTGKYDISIFRFPFYGYGNFTMAEYTEIHKMVSLSNVHTLNFYVTYKNVVSGIGAFITGLYRNDVVRQREYLSNQDYAFLLDEAERRFTHNYGFI